MHPIWLIKRAEDDSAIPELLACGSNYKTLYTDQADAIRAAWMLSLTGKEWVVVSLSVSA